jgi:quinol monooxygenase YgiN
MIIVEFKMTVRPEKQAEYLRYVSRLVALIKNEPGCIDCRMHKSLEEVNTFILVEEWESGVHLDWHIHWDTFKSLSQGRDLMSGRPEVKIIPIIQGVSMETSVAS